MILKNAVMFNSFQNQIISWSFKTVSFRSIQFTKLHKPLRRACYSPLLPENKKKKRIKGNCSRTTKKKVISRSALKLAKIFPRSNPSEALLAKTVRLRVLKFYPESWSFPLWTGGSSTFARVTCNTTLADWLAGDSSRAYTISDVGEKIWCFCDMKFIHAIASHDTFFLFF